MRNTTLREIIDAIWSFRPVEDSPFHNAYASTRKIGCPTDLSELVDVQWQYRSKIIHRDFSREMPIVPIGSNNTNLYHFIYRIATTMVTRNMGIDDTISAEELFYIEPAPLGLFVWIYKHPEIFKKDEVVDYIIELMITLIYLPDQDIKIKMPPPSIRTSFLHI